MNNHEFTQAEGQVRDLCDEMSVKQLKNLLTNLEYDLDEKKEKD